MKVSHLKNIIKEQVKKLSENQLLLEYPTMTLGEATDWCAENCWPKFSCNIKAVTFIFGDGSTHEGYDSECGEGKTRGPITAPPQLDIRKNEFLDTSISSISHLNMPYTGR